MTITGTPVDNGVNTAALLGAREALTAAPEAAEFTWRATCSWVNGTHSRSTVETFAGLGQEHTHESTFTFDADHPECFASEDHGATPAEIVLVALGSCLTGRRRRRRPEPRDPAAQGHGDRRGRHERARHPRRRPRRPQRLSATSASASRSTPTPRPTRSGARRPVAEAVGGVRRDHQPDQRRRRRRLTRRPRAGDASSRRRHRRRPRRAGHESPPHRALDRPRRDRAR